MSRKAASIACQVGLALLLACTPRKQDESPSYAAWTPPVGDSLQGVTFHEGWEDLRQLSPPVSNDGWNDSPFATPDGKRIYFAYTQWDFFKLYRGSGIFATGEARSGMTSPEFDLFQADLTTTGWEVSRHPVNPSSQPEGAVGANEAEDVLVWVRFDSSGKGDLYYAAKSGGSWGPAYALTPWNTACEEDNVHVVGSQAAATVYFDSDRADLAGTSCGSAKRVYQASFSNGVFGPVSEVPGINAGVQDKQLFVTADKTKAYWTSVRTYNGVLTQGIFSAELQGGGSYGDVRLLMSPTRTDAASLRDQTLFLGEASIVELPEGWLMYLACGVGRYEGNGNALMTDIDNIRINLCVARKRR
jgi:hypothetical protein